MENNQAEKMMYLLQYMSDYIESLVYDVLNDSEDDPHYSAVTANNLLKCYIDVMTYFHVQLSYRNMEEYFTYNLLTKEEYLIFQKKMSIESKYYIGKIY